jgi:hypothetical protein
MRFLKKTRNVKNGTVHAHSLFSAFMGDPCFLGCDAKATKRSPKGPKSATTFFVRVAFSQGPKSDLFWKKNTFFKELGR